MHRLREEVALAVSIGASLLSVSLFWTIKNLDAFLHQLSGIIGRAIVLK
jgi:hypothetical protein